MANLDQKQKSRILLIQDNAEYAKLVGAALVKGMRGDFELHSVSTLQAGIKYIEKETTDCVLLELSLPDAQGIKAFEELHHYAWSIPIIILSSFDQEMDALQAIRKGAQDYVLKAELGEQLLSRIIQNAIERHLMRNRLQSLSLRDDLTGLYNRRGFFLLAEQQLKLTKRNKKNLLLILADLDGLKQINDKYGHSQGDSALLGAAHILQESFRKSDILARIGGDEFAVVVIDAPLKDMPILRSRVHQQSEAFNHKKNGPYRLSLSLGCAVYDPDKITFVEQLVLDADQSLYQNKREKTSTTHSH